MRGEGAKRWSALLAAMAIATVAHGARAAVEAVPTFHSIGLAWSGSGGSAGTRCLVRFRAEGASTWTDGPPLWFDGRAAGSGTSAARPANEYRGSLVQLKPATSYEIELTLEGKGTTTSVKATTWSEAFPIGKTTKLPATSSSTLSITTSGTRDGWALYVPEGDSATIDVANKANNDVYVDASFVIIRGLTLKGAATNAIELGPNAHDVVIEENDISGWGKAASDGWGIDNAAVMCNNRRAADRIVIQRNEIHHPRTDANNWEEPRPARGGDPHPWGPQAVIFESCGSNHVIRYNAIWSDADHYFNDAIGGGDNFSFEGFPRADSDIYGNAISHCWDDGIEAEGGNRNVRVFGNFIDKTFVKIAVATTSIGPVYVFRNVANLSRRSHLTAAAQVDGEDRGPFLKMGSRDATYRGGRIFVLHNTVLQPRDAAYANPLGCGAGLESSGGPVSEVFARNNILQVWKASWRSVGDDSRSTTSSYDFDLYNGQIVAAAGQESKGIKGTPKYLADGFTLDETSPGFDVGARLPGFNDDFVGAGPDIGAYENGGKPLEFGVNAGKTSAPDGGSPDGGADGGTSPDGSVVEDGGAPAPTRDDADAGCGCRTNAAPPSASGGWSLLAALAPWCAGLLRRRGRLRLRHARALHR